MFINEKLKLNKFREVAIPKANDMFARLGYRTTPETSFTGDEELIEGNKLEQLAEQTKLYEKYAAEEAKKQAKKIRGKY